MKKRFLAICMTILLATTAVGCGAKAECSALIKDLEKAIVQMDIDAALDCYNPDSVAGLKMILNTIGSGKEQLQSGIYKILGITVEEGEESKDVLKNVELKIDECDLGKESGTVTCTLSFKVGEDTIQKEIVFEVIKVDDQWYINGTK